MKIETLTLENYRGFRSLTLDLPQQCLLVGRNGSGKSTVVDAITIGLDHLVVNLMASTAWSQQWGLVDEDIHHDEGMLAATLHLDRGQVVTTLERGDDPNLNHQGVVKCSIDTDSLPILLSCRPNRLFHPFGPAPDAASFPHTMLRRVSEALWMSLLAGPDTFGQVVPWFRREENAENETRLRRDPAYRHRSLEVVRSALTTFLNGLGTGAYVNPRISRVDARGNSFVSATDGALVFDKDGQPITITQLSDGERTTLLMVMDIARRLVIANPKDDPLQGTGIVLIDEVELHLHPAWQRAVLPALFATFPNIQFIATTHSPQVLASVPSECVRILENFQAYPVGHTEGRDSNALLREIFDVPERPQPALDKLERVAALIDAEDFAAARAALAELRDALSAQDGEVVRLQSLLAFLEA